MSEVTHESKLVAENSKSVFFPLFRLCFQPVGGSQTCLIFLGIFRAHIVFICHAFPSNVFLREFVVFIITWNSGSVWSSVLRIWCPVFLSNLQSQQVIPSVLKFVQNKNHAVYSSPKQTLWWHCKLCKIAFIPFLYSADSWTINGGWLTLLIQPTRVILQGLCRTRSGNFCLISPGQAVQGFL